MFETRVSRFRNSARPSAVWPLPDGPAHRDEPPADAADTETLGALHDLGRRRCIARGEMILLGQDEGWACANILSGLFKLSALTAEGREQIVGLLRPFDFVAHPSVADSEFTVTALSDSVICVFSAANLERILKDDWQLASALLRRTLRTLDEARWRMLLLGCQSAEVRVVAFLLEMADQRGDPAPGAAMTIDLLLSRGAIASLLGLSIETVSRQITRLKARGLIALPGARAVTILRRNELQRIVDSA